MLATHVPVGAQTAPSTSGTLIVVPATGEVRALNDQVTVIFVVEEHDKDKRAAAARVNRKMKEGMGIVRLADPKAELKTKAYTTYAIYPERPDTPRPASRRQAPEAPIGWRVSQTLELKTMNLADLPKTVAAGQKVMEVDGLHFGLSPALLKRLDDQRIAETYRNLNERIVSIARAMGREPGEAVIDTVDFEGSGNYAPLQRVEVTGSRIRPEDMDVPEPSFEPGETTLQMRLVGKLRFR
ncbi:SIMPL domain-containing protein [Massilia sp.]|uniref:SIMPL domain-containing protein n=1 Tax=Massilia sp. TaxID=1882437 RepID=UPI0028A70DD2|nr:SIMPL domain-containing protein [Massilia sp.]